MGYGTDIGGYRSDTASALTGVTLGTGVASKALTLDASGHTTMPDNGRIRPSTASVAAAGSTQSDATAMTDQLNAVTAADGTKGVALPAAAAQEWIIVINTVATALLKVYPVNGGNDAINGLSANDPILIAPGMSVMFVATSATQWYAEAVAATTAGTGAANQPLVLNSSGNVAMPDNGILALSRGTVAAAGTTSADATALTDQLALVTGADNAKGVALPAAATTTGPFVVVNTDVDARLFVYPVDGGNDNINGLAEDAAYEMGPGEMCIFTPTSATQWYTGVVHNRFNAEVVTTTNVIAASENGKTFFIDAAGGFVSTLPAPAAGLRFTFIIKTSLTSNATIVTSGSSNIVCGQVHTLDVNSATDPDFTATADQDTVTLVANKAVKGDRIEFWCDGTSWYVHAFTSVFDAITLDQAG